MDRSARLIMGIFEDKCFFQKMLILAVPVMIQNFIASFLNMVDTVMVGRLGEVEIAAVGIANQYFFFYNMFLIGQVLAVAFLSPNSGVKRTIKTSKEY